ncbi:tRNA pseudouridine(38-40) synthase TruA [Cohaesibacter sp. CAU 1516]|uniref:tRNA pseudouridine(38-40) synthase TruA n=1 Tax=Cohaesibacter sp. CAU 1516 TaxID=2576038 RepID=UPI0010FEBB2B|nr:tRNA pseudouridine(38-40) synthase TruA [Cohaesibacter sp. CAU 1516]TLP45965.1 tRNA pseudouridine(38-40) synthase TruA [Cohaesibacter sp. CAU 1516]
MPRYKLLIEYDGRPFAGWQRQDNAPTVMGLIEQSLFKFTREQVTLFGAGRTDSGVHATGQIAHFDLMRDWHSQKVREALNHFLKETGVAILGIEKVTDAFDSRFMATRRYYRYRICNRRAPLTFEMGRAWQYSYPIDVDLMQEGANRLIGHFDFTTFRATACQAKSPWRTMEKLTISREGEWVYLDAMSRSFLHNQIRSIVGSLAEVGSRRKPVEWVSDILEARDRRACGPVAPPDGLYLTQVDYPEDADFVIPEAPWRGHSKG